MKVRLDGSAKTLADLQECHLHTVPYENLDIMNRIALSLDPQDVYQKIVVRGRGGYCFELNALFGWLLRELGYPVTDLVARFWRDEPNTPPKRRHHVLKVEAEGTTYLCDVGVGGIVPRRPIAWIEGLEQHQGGECYRLDRDDYYGWVLCEQKNKEWNRIYSFTEEPQLPKDLSLRASGVRTPLIRFLLKMPNGSYAHPGGTEYTGRPRVSHLYIRGGKDFQSRV